MRAFADTGDRMVNISLLARSAGVARGTIYAHLTDLDSLFDIVADEMAERINAQVACSWANVREPHLRIALFMATLIKLTHVDPAFGRYMVRFAPSTPALHRAWSDLLPAEVRRSVTERVLPRFPDGIGYFVQLLSGATYAYMILVIEGRATWRDASRNLIVMGLKAGGLDDGLARTTAHAAIDRIIDGLPPASAIGTTSELET